ncbi:hypothetical protein [Mycobacteroides abscessus]|uniref:hypothetical protein n=1 Tax=Mycobacteroides abscessus TaxID=36809 RepID=UPI0012FFD47F|nr:hypothetical protein [Mycobacteroides abscessus]
MCKPEDSHRHRECVVALSPTVDAVQLVRCAAVGNTKMRDVILCDYQSADCDSSTPDVRYLVSHMAYFVVEIARARITDETRWLDIRLLNLTPGEHRDAHLIVYAILTGDWLGFWKHLDPYLPDDALQCCDHWNALQELVFEIAALANAVRHARVEAYIDWPDGLFESRRRVAMQSLARSSDETHSPINPAN